MTLPLIDETTAPEGDRTMRQSYGADVANRRIVLKTIPVGEPKPSDFEVVKEQVPPIADGQMLLRTKWLTLDPYMRGLDASGPMNNEGSIGSTIVGGTVSEVLESRASGWSEGDLVVGYYGWREYSVGTPEDLQWGNKAMPIEKWDGSLGPPSTALGILGMTGYAAYAGLLNVATVKTGETVVVSAASGAVGQVVGQLAKIQGCRVVGIAGGPRKCAFCVDELGFDACIDYKAGDLSTALAAAVPDGIDVYFESVGGEVLEAVIPLLNPGCRVPVAGWVSQYNTPSNNAPWEQQQATPLQRLREVGLNELGDEGSTEGFRFFHFNELAARQPDASEALRTMSGWIKEGKLKYRESITHGLDSSVDAFIGMLRGENFGKTMVQIS
jgi:NADPH-dependent curcumin reductase CurA